MSSMLQAPDRLFARMMMVAGALHVLVLLAIAFWPEQAVQEIPVRQLNISLGGDVAALAAPTKSTPAASEHAPQVAPPEPPKVLPEPAVKKTKPAPKKVKKKAVKKVQKPKVSRRAASGHTPSQHVRRKTAPKPQANAGSAGISPTEIKKRYEQTMSAWLQRHRVMSDMARKLGQHGRPVLRVQIDRRGALKYFAIERSSGYPLVDQAAMDMVRRANPFPVPPAGYPGAQLLEFLIPVQFDPPTP